MCFDVVLAGCEKMRNPLMAKPRIAPELLQQQWNALKTLGRAREHWMVKEVVKKFRPPAGVSAETLEACVMKYIDEAIGTAVDLTDELTKVNPFAAMPDWFVKLSPQIESLRRVINDVGVAEMIRAMQVYLGIDLLRKGNVPAPGPEGQPPPLAP